MTTSARRGSSASRRRMASSRASTSSAGGSIQASPSASSTRLPPPPRFWRPLRRAPPLRISRLARPPAPQEGPPRRRPEEVAAALPAGVLALHQAEVRLVHQGGRLEGLAGPALGRQRRGQAPQLRVQLRQ